MADTATLINSGVGEDELKQLLKDMVHRESAKLDQETRELGEQCDQQSNGLARSIEAQTSAHSKVTSLREVAAKHEETVSDKQAELDWAIEQEAKTEAALADAEQDKAEADSVVADSQAELDRMTKELTTRKAEVDAVKVNVTRRAIESLRKILQPEDELEPAHHAPADGLASKPCHDATFESYEVGSNKQHSAEHTATQDQEERGSLGSEGFNTPEGSVTMRAESTVYHDATERVQVPTSSSPSNIVVAVNRPAASKPVPPKRKPWRPTERSEKEYAAAQPKYEAELAVWMQNNATNESGAAKKRKTVTNLENAA
ncbi:hypothetical protein LTR56_003815 [Elasticomyces elasticus]|nr:hypothetical protein LTR22_013124 [Elasticomyces elasticus]KAK3654957.1 hypothetical protein LTR56_003815 [Elasticomyces elasticus]KAK4928711.1 hypothetical protein LTR49_004520 [Elasticomyces elasticus]KAK5766661.1 hypothetical protein LTS12_003280 [Elasticomyces elasticus]